MKTLTSTLVSLFFISTLLLSCSKEDDGVYFNDNAEVVNTNNISYSSIENEILKLVNNHRASLGLSTLSTLNIISGVADGHTNYMIEVGGINHDNFSQSSEYLKKQAHAISVGENVAYGFNTAQGVFNGWLNSQAHRNVIENPNYTHFGISTDSDNENKNYFTQIFIKK